VTVYTGYICTYNIMHINLTYHSIATVYSNYIEMYNYCLLYWWSTCILHNYYSRFIRILLCNLLQNTMKILNIDLIL